MECISAVCHRGSGSAVETEPAEPEDENAQRHSHHVVAGNGFYLSFPVVLADSGAQHPGAQTGNDTAHVVHDRTSGEVMESQTGKPAAAPGPVPADRIDQKGNSRGISAVGLEIGPLCHGSRDDGRGCRAEDRLEDHIAPERHGLWNDRVPCPVKSPDHGIQTADQRRGASEHESEADQPVAGCSDTEIHHIFHQDISGVLGPGQTCFTEREARLHEIDQGSCDQYPCDS